MLCRVAHAHIDGQRYGDHDADIDVECFLHASLFEPQGDEFGRAAEQRIGQGIRQRPPQRADMRRKQLSRPRRFGCR